LSRPYPSRSSSPSVPFVRVNGKIRAREVRVIGVDGHQLGVMSLGDALTMARANGVDLVEVAPNAAPPVCRLVDFGKYRYELAKREKESKKHQHANKVKEVQLSPKIDPHDLSVKVGHAVDFLCEDMKLKVTLKFRGRENAHTEYGFQVVEKFLTEIAPYGHADFEPKLNGRAINVMISPLPRNKRAKHPGGTAGAGTVAPVLPGTPPQLDNHEPLPVEIERPQRVADPRPAGGFANNPFAQLEVKQ
jgi:translation initiation factor IF-3